MMVPRYYPNQPYLKGKWLLARELGCALQKIDVDFTERTPPAYLGDQHNATLYL